jgi:hypothetical protein
MSVERRGFVGIFSEPLRKPRVQEIIMLWMSRFGTVEQTVGKNGQVLTLVIRSEEDLMWTEKDLQFRVTSGEQFAWIYLTQDRFVMETSGLSSEAATDLLCRDVLTNVSGCEEVIDERNNSRLDELEQGLL